MTDAGQKSGRKDWYSAGELADARLPGLPSSKSALQDRIGKEGWLKRKDADGIPLARRRRGRGGGMEYHVSLLPRSARASLTRRDAMAKKAAGNKTASDKTARDKTVGDKGAIHTAGTQASKHTDHSSPTDIPTDSTTGSSSYELWNAFERLSDRKKAVARDRLETLTLIEELVAGRAMGKSEAVRHIASVKGASPASIHGWFRRVAGASKSDRLPMLADRRAGGNKGWSACNPMAWEVLKADWLRLEQPSFSSCYRRLEGMAQRRGWQIPPEPTLRRRMEREIPEAVIVLCREGRRALEVMYPPQERDRTDFRAMEAVNADGHTWDVWVNKWPGDRSGDRPGDRPARPVMVAFQDLYSNKILSWRLDRTENADLVRLAFADMVEEHGIPEQAWLDNGRAFASKFITGRQTTRFRNKIKPEDPSGVMTDMGVEVHWTKPYSGQSKPIERAFRDFCDAIAKHPMLAGAYAGNSPLSKPDYPGGTIRPVAYDTFIRVVGEGIREHNARAGRRTRVCGATLSFDEAFEKSLAAREAAQELPVRRASADQIAACMLAMDSVRLNAQDGSFKIAGNRYWLQALHEHRGKKMTIRFDPDWLHAPARVYRLDGSFVCTADCVRPVGFADTASAREWERKRRRMVKLTKEQADTRRRMPLRELQRLLPDVDELGGPSGPKSPVRLAASGAARTGVAEADTAPWGETANEEDAFMDALRSGLRLVKADDDILQG